MPKVRGLNVLLVVMGCVGGIALADEVKRPSERLVPSLSGNRPQQQQRERRKPWTVLVCAAAESSESPALKSLYKHLEGIHEQEGLNIAVCAYCHNQTGVPVLWRGALKSGRVVQLAPEQAVVDEQQAIEQAYSWSSKQFPSTQCALVLWDHDTGCGFEETAVQEALTTMLRMNKGKKLDVLITDGCLFGQVDTACVLHDTVNYWVTAQHMQYGNGFTYAPSFNAVTARSCNARTIVQTVVRRYEQEYKESGTSYAVAAIDVTRMGPVVKSLNQAGRALSTLLRRGYSAIRSEIVRACGGSAASDFVDATHLYSSLYHNVPAFGVTKPRERDQLKKALQDGMYAAQDIVAERAVCGVAEYVATGGLSLYLPHDGLDLEAQESYVGKHTRWFAFLREYLGIKS